MRQRALLQQMIGWSTSASVPKSTSTQCLVEHANQPDLFGRHGPCKSKDRATQNAGYLRVRLTLRAGNKEIKIESITCPLDGNILDYFSGQYSNVFVSLHPFIRSISIDPEAFYPETYPTKTEILKTCEPVSWIEALSIFGLSTLGELDIALRSRIHGLNKIYHRKDLASLLDSIPNLICPTEGCFSPFTENGILHSLTNFGYSKLLLRDEHVSKVSSYDISDLMKFEEIPYAGSIMTEDKEFYATTHWDSHFSFLCSTSEDRLKEIVQKSKIEGFFCDNTTEVYWSIRNLTLPST